MSRRQRKLSAQVAGRARMAGLSAEERQELARLAGLASGRARRWRRALRKRP